MSADGLTIRVAVREDFLAIADLLNRAYAALGTSLGETPETVEERSEDSLIIVLEAEGTILATATTAPPGSFHGRMALPGQAELSRLAVDPAYQGHGFGSLLLDTIIASMKRQGLQAIVGLSLETMTTAHRMYEAAGAKPETVPGGKARRYVLDLQQ